jgi:DNA-directed RNA polymerase
VFRFEHGLPLNGDTYWLEINAANTEGSTDKESWPERIKWVHEHREDIQKIAAHPFDTFDKGVLDNRGWKSADSPFQFVAACRELAAAWADPENFVTHLPIGFDGSANGLQHLALLAMDLHAAAMVNLCGTGDDSPRDVYAIIIAKALELIESDDSDHAVFWRERFEILDHRQKRKLLKQPIMTFAYSVTPAGAALQINKVYRGFRQNAKPPEGAFGYLARKVLEACAIELPGPARIMEYIQEVAEYCADRDRFLEGTSPSGFPVSNRYQVPNIVTVNCMHGSVRVAQHLMPMVSPTKLTAAR